ncbi:MAG: peptidoglycan DD-metalloendopeptidase family protein [Candidatus Zixiibacteriota bacterium]|nr:MAG: peptidoglycan DD-metalloendopeptidase family protein [candidate division Zixibacteria bacterium]
MRDSAVIVLVSLSFLTGLSFADDTERRKQIEEFQEMLDLKRSRYGELTEREKSQIEKLRDVEEQMALSNQLVLKLKRESGRLNRSISDHDAELKKLNVDYEKKKQALYKRMEYIYKHGNKPLWFSLISSGNPTEAAVAFKNMKSLMEYDRQLVTSLKAISQKIETELSRMKNEKRMLDNLEEDYRAELELRETSLSIRKELLEKIRSDKSEVARAITSLEDDAAAVSEIIANLDRKTAEQATSRELPGLAEEKGNLIWPVQGEIVRPFGSIKDKRGIRLTNPGIDIKGLSGSNVSAAATGIVIYISWLRGYGQFIIIDHGDGYYTLYANLIDIFVETGDMVRAGESIAKIGDLGSVEGPNLHFELRLKKESLDPLKWLR